MPVRINIIWQRCPNCGRPNIPERRICKRCRTALPLPSEPLAPPAATGVTGKLYTAPETRQLLFLVPYYLEYTCPRLTIRTVWENIGAIRGAQTEDYLWLKQPAVLKRNYVPGRIMDAWGEQTIPLRCFGYPTNQELLADLQRFAPQLWKRRWGWYR